MSVAGLQGHPLATPVGFQQTDSVITGVLPGCWGAEKTNKLGVLGSSHTARAGPEGQWWGPAHVSQGSWSRVC